MERDRFLELLYERVVDSVGCSPDVISVERIRREIIVKTRKAGERKSIWFDGTGWRRSLNTGERYLGMDEKNGVRLDHGFVNEDLESLPALYSRVDRSGLRSSSSWVVGAPDEWVSNSFDLVDGRNFYEDRDSLQNIRVMRFLRANRRFEILPSSTNGRLDFPRLAIDTCKPENEDILYNNWQIFLSKYDGCTFMVRPEGVEVVVSFGNDEIISLAVEGDINELEGLDFRGRLYFESAARKLHNGQLKLIGLGNGKFIADGYIKGFHTRFLNEEATSVVVDFFVDQLLHEINS